ncbi:hypothetical protein F441_10707 [Phytophthora nicotianae CJ01A1]|uniref:Uncharacterized protein n=2 Tax=Phytophthora nicotianae TaxID=4792 RepID=W2GNQ8_PHYNI|nr:hypothetical protein L915_10524 [Phytophthora nicotianae]ETL37944.1 hypothetical protein L916_10413 [Phytophthora nicotianae]ETP14343.1 hypothetical protein F441_10707 [Phytophthora nicotianae CJ01A1]
MPFALHVCDGGVLHACNQDNLVGHCMLLWFRLPSNGRALQSPVQLKTRRLILEAMSSARADVVHAETPSLGRVAVAGEYGVRNAVSDVEDTTIFFQGRRGMRAFGKTREFVATLEERHLFNV